MNEVGSAPTSPSRSRPGGALHFSGAGLLVALGLLFAVLPFIAKLPHAPALESILLTLVFLSAVLAIGGQRRTLILAALLALPALVGKWLNSFRPDLVTPEFFLIAAIIFGLFVVVQMQLFLMRARPVDAQVLCAAISVYLLMGLIWSFAYVLVTAISPGSFSLDSSIPSNGPMDGFTAVYFSFGTQSTAGFGDVTPVSNAARMLAVMQATVGSLYLAVLIARLVGVYASTQSHELPDT